VDGTDSDSPINLARIRVAVNGFVRHDDRVLLVEFDDVTGLHYNLPGGGVEVGETLEEALHREIAEETSLHVSIERLLLVVESVGARNTNLINGLKVPWNELRFFFLCAPIPGSIARLPERPDLHETAVRWVPIASLPDIAVLPAVSRELIEAVRSSQWAPRVIANPQA
jgi:8-oxo-dGTP diphosphatase